MLVPLAVLPSPKFQLKLYGCNPPEVEGKKEIDCPVTPVGGMMVNEVKNCGVILMVNR